MILLTRRLPTVVFALLLAAMAANGNPTVAVPEATETALQFFWVGVGLWAAELVLAVLIPLTFLVTGFSVKLQDALRVRIQHPFFSFVVFASVLGVLYAIFTTPLDYYRGFVHLHNYGLSNQSFSRWTINYVGGVVGLAFFGLPLISLFYGLLKWSPRFWWFYISLSLVPVYLILVLLGPVAFDPLFNDFGPMKDKHLEAKIVGLAERAGLERGQVFEVNKSADTNAVNAYVTGFAGTRRIVLWDTIIEKLDEDELLFVMGHEIGHFVLGHIQQGLVVLIFGTFLFTFLLKFVSERLLAGFPKLFQVSRLSEPGAIPVMLLVGTILAILFNPVGMAVSRHFETEADRFALEISRSNQAGATAFVKMQSENLSNPRPPALIKWMRSSHPSISERVDFCNRYRPWEREQPGVYEHLFKP